MELGTCHGCAAPRLFLFALWVRQYHGTCVGHVHSVPGGDSGRRRSALSGAVFAGGVLEPQCVTHALRHHASAHLFWLGLCESTNVVAARAVDITCEHTHLGSRGICLVEGSGIVVRVCECGSGGASPSLFSSWIS